tara:strand:- start:149 stop:622 length:474 start_codon:yes stop_codon:yes gene_type:complete
MSLLNIRSIELQDVISIDEKLIKLALETGLGWRDKRNIPGLIKYGFSNNPLFKGFVAEVKSKTVGVCLYFITFSEWEGLPTINIQDLYVDKEHRKNKIAVKLIQAVIKKEKLTCIKLMVSSSNIKAKEFYNKIGFHYRPEEQSYYIGGKEILELENK